MDRGGEDAGREEKRINASGTPGAQRLPVPRFCLVPFDRLSIRRRDK